MKPSNVKSAWSGAGPILLNSQKVIRRVKATFSEQETAWLLTVDDTPSDDSNHSHAQKFSLVPHTLSQVNSVALRSASEALAHNVQAGIFDTPMKEYILKESALVTQYETIHTV